MAELDTAMFDQAIEGDTTALRALLTRYGPEARRAIQGKIGRKWRSVLEERPPAELSTRELDAIRRMLFRMEDGYRKKDDLRV